MEDGKKVIYLRIPRALKQRVKAMANQYGVSMNELCNVIFQLDVEKKEEEDNGKRQS